MGENVHQRAGGREGEREAVGKREEKCGCVGVTPF